MSENLPAQELTKVCSKCQLEKPLSEFSKKRVAKDGLRSQCKDCDNSYSRQQHFKNHSENLKRIAKFRIDNPEYFINYKTEHKEEIKLDAKKYYKKNKKEINFKKRQYHRRQYQTNIPYKIKQTLRSRVHRAIKNDAKSGHSIELIMCSVEKLKSYLEEKFLPGMNWNNYGFGNDKWNIDHVIPCSFFELSDPVEQHMCFRWQNLQPLWQTDNFEKSDKIINQE